VIRGICAGLIAGRGSRPPRGLPRPDSTVRPVYRDPAVPSHGRRILGPSRLPPGRSAVCTHQEPARTHSTQLHVWVCWNPSYHDREVKQSRPNRVARADAGSYPRMPSREPMKCSSSTGIATSESGSGQGPSPWKGDVRVTAPMQGSRTSPCQWRVRVRLAEGRASGQPGQAQQKRCRERLPTRGGHSAARRQPWQRGQGRLAVAFC
jgi:hypothetical protein